MNHFHYHCICYPAELILDNISLDPFHKGLKVISSRYPIRALVTEIKPEESEIKEKSNILENIINILYEMDIAHNVVITRSKENITRWMHSCIRNIEKDSFDAYIMSNGFEFSGTYLIKFLRFFIFPRIKADTSIVSQCVDPACVEFSGQFPCKDELSWLGCWTVFKTYSLLQGSSAYTHPRNRENLILIWLWNFWDPWNLTKRLRLNYLIDWRRRYNLFATLIVFMVLLWC